MAIVVPEVGERNLLNMLLRTASPPDFEILLFSNDYTPVETSAYGDFTIHTAAGLNVVKTLSRAGWAAATTSSGVTSSVYAQQSWQNTSGSTQSVYGYIVREAGTSNLLWAERFTNAPILLANNDYMFVTPRLELE
jgi:hypothetical protein